MSQDMKLTNLSNCKSDGIVLFYMKNGKLHPIVLNEEQATMMDFIITIPFAGSNMLVDSKPVEYLTIKHMLK